jgi:hypothetical protein
MTEGTAPKPAHRLHLIIAALILLSPLLGWVCTFVYWKVRIAAALQSWAAELQVRPTRQPADAIPRADSELLQRAGCRAFPQMVDAKNRSADPYFQSGIMTRLLTGLLRPGPLVERDFREWEDRNSRFSLYAEGLEFERKEKLGDFNAWWASNGQRYHQGWRVWSSWCHGD